MYENLQVHLHESPLYLMALCCYSVKYVLLTKRESQNIHQKCRGYVSYFYELFGMLNDGLIPYL